MITHLPRAFALALALAALASAAAPAAATPQPTAPAAAGPAPAAPSAARQPAAAAPSPAEIVLVLPFAARGDAEPEWLSAGAAEYLAETLAASGHAVLDADTRDEALSDVGLAEAQRLTLASACELARRVNARWLLTGSWTANASKLSFRARLIDARSLRTVREAAGDGHVTALASLLAGLAIEIGGEGARTGAARKEIDRLGTSKQDVLMSWMQAAAEPDNAVQHLTAALALDAQFIPALLDLAEARLDGGEPEQVSSVVAKLPVTAGLHHRARARVLEGRALLALGDTRGAMASLGDAVKLRPDVEALVWLAEAQLASGDRPAAIATARRVLDAVPDESHALEIIDRAENPEPDTADTAETDAVEPG